MKDLMYINEGGYLIRFKAVFNNKILHILDSKDINSQPVKQVVNSKLIFTISDDLDVDFPDRIFLYDHKGFAWEIKHDGLTILKDLDLNKYGYEKFIRELVGRRSETMKQRGLI
jgi:hypothetical protein